MIASYISGKEIDREAWDAFVRDSPQGSIYLLSGFLDAVAEGWSGIEVRLDGKLKGIMPLHLKKKGPYSYALQPAFAQYWGICFAPELSGKAYNEFRDKSRIVNAALEALPKLDWYAWGFAPEFDYPQPFHWAGATLHTRYTWRLDLSEGMDAVLAGMRKSLRRDIRQSKFSEEDYEVVHETGALLELVRLQADAGKQILTDEEQTLCRKLGSYLFASGQGHVFQLRQEGAVIAAALFAEFGGQLLYLMGATHPEFKTPLMPPLLFEAMKPAAGKGLDFDFEGSMKEPIEQFFRAFGPRPVPYLYIEKNTLPLPIRWIRNSL